MSTGCSKKRVFLLGAGFSKMAGLPIINEFKDFLLRYLESSPESNCKEFCQELKPILSVISTKYPKLLNNFELFITFLDLSLNISDKSFNIFEGVIEDLNIFRMKLTGSIVDAFWWGSLSFINNKKEDQTSGLYSKFYDALREGDAVVTFNYDLLVESGLWEQNKWTFLDGYGFEKQKHDFECKDMGQLYPAGKPESSLIKIHKLHGSVGWLYDEISEKVFFNEMNNYLNAYQGVFCENGGEYLGAQHDRASTFIEPSYIKSYKKTFSMRIWNNAAKAIMECDELFIIGYSMPEADSAAHLLISSAVSESKISKITVVDPLPDTQNKFRICFGKTVVPEGLPFEEWISKQ